MSEPRVTQIISGLIPAQGLIRKTEHPSENFLSCRDLLGTPTITKVMALADRVEAGGEITVDDLTVLYEDGLSGIVNLAIDAVNMVGRRDDRIAELEAEVQAYVERDAGASI